MNRHQLLAELHACLRPRNYLEIGVNDGQSLRLSRVPTIAVDPAFRITSALRCDLHLVRATIDSSISALLRSIRRRRVGRTTLLARLRDAAEELQPVRS